MSHLGNAIVDGFTGTWMWYGHRRFHHWTGWLRPWRWVKFWHRPNHCPEPYDWRLTIGPLELRKVRGTR